MEARTFLKPELPPRFVRISEAISFYSLLVLIALTAIPYGAAEGWWKALFQCAVFFLAGLSVVFLLCALAAAVYLLRNRTRLPE